MFKELAPFIRLELENLQSNPDNFIDVCIKNNFTIFLNKTKIFEKKHLVELEKNSIKSGDEIFILDEEHNIHKFVVKCKSGRKLEN